MRQSAVETVAAGAFARPPRAERPDSPPPSYGVPRRGGRMVDWDHVVERLRGASAYWLGTVTPHGRPHVVPTWGVFVGHDLYLETGAPQTIKSRNLALNRHVVVHLDDPGDVVIVRGTAVPFVPPRELGAAMAAAYREKYTGYEPHADSWDGGGLIRIRPDSILAWGDMPTATRWRFTGQDR